MRDVVHSRLAATCSPQGLKPGGGPKCDPGSSHCCCCCSSGSAYERISRNLANRPPKDDKLALTKITNYRTGLGTGTAWAGFSDTPPLKLSSSHLRTPALGTRPADSSRDSRGSMQSWLRIPPASCSNHSRDGVRPLVRNDHRVSACRGSAKSPGRWGGLRSRAWAFQMGRSGPS